MSKKTATTKDLNSYISPFLENFKMKEDLLQEDLEWSMDDYFKAIMKKQNASSFREVSRLIGISSKSINDMHHERILPSEETMMRIADLAGRSQLLALFDLRILKASEEIRSMYRNVKKELINRAKGVLTVLIIVFAALISLAKNADAACGNTSQYIIQNYTLSHNWRRLRRWLKRLFSGFFTPSLYPLAV